MADEIENFGIGSDESSNLRVTTQDIVNQLNEWTIDEFHWTDEAVRALIYALSIDDQLIEHIKRLTDEVREQQRHAP